uniref:Uncharacterized protein n=1 Tax=Meloidogyne incognita TaxID=6306 RepID=A0A914M2J1_MELIC
MCLNLRSAVRAKKTFFSYNYSAGETFEPDGKMTLKNKCNCCINSKISSGNNVKLKGNNS